MVTRPEWGQPRKSVLLCTQMRSGSWMLSDLCHQTGLLGHPEEYFRPDFRRHWLGEWGLTRDRSYGEYIASAVGLTSTSNGVFGVKMHAYQMDWLLRQLRVIWGADPEADDMDTLGRWLPDPNFVHLTRLDVPRQAISYYRAIHSKVWFDLGGDPTPSPNQDDPASAPQEPNWSEIRYLENGLVSQEHMWSTFFERNEIEPVELVYEDLAANPSGALEAILESFDLEVPEDLSFEPRIQKQADALTERWYEQYMLVRDSVEPTPPRPLVAPGATDDQPTSAVPRRMKSTNAPVVFGDAGRRPVELTPVDYLEERASWAELVASLVFSGLGIGAATALVDALPGEGAIRPKTVANPEWRRGLTPLPPPVADSPG